MAARRDTGLACAASMNKDKIAALRNICLFMMINSAFSLAIVAPNALRPVFSGMRSAGDGSGKTAA
jgi:hypothetical protein